MFLRNIARSLSSSSITSKRSAKKTKDQHQDRQQQQQQLSRPPSSAPRSVQDLRVGASSQADPTALCPPSRAQSQTPFEAERAKDLSPSASATIVGTTGDRDQQLYPPRPATNSTSAHHSADLPVSASVHIPPRGSDPTTSESAIDRGDKNPASNFPSRLLHPQTLSPTADNNHHTGDTTDHQQHRHRLPPSSHLISSSVTSPNSDEPGIAMQRKVWVKRPGASATRVEVNEDDLVDNVRDAILHKYANSLGRHIDSPDITLKIASREQANKNVASERILGPEEAIGRTLDTYYPGGQTIEEALLIDVMQKRTPRPSPRPGNHMSYYVAEDYRPGDGAREYFPPMPLHSPHIPHVQHPAGPNGALPIHSMSVLTTGQVPALPSPGGHSQRRHPRPKYGRQHTSSPTIMHVSQTNGIDAKSQNNGVAPAAQPLPTPPPTGDKAVMPPPNRTSSPHPSKSRKKRQPASARDMNGEQPLPAKPASASLLDGRVPPINVLLVEDNVINLKLLEQFMKRLKVRWKSAMNGKEAVNMWRTGGFHLVLMDIQLPVMNGLEATKEIRRLESVNGIGLSVFGETKIEGQINGNGHIAPEDKLEERELFKSPVIIVALTASSLQSDRHEALAVGCNDFLTKPVNFGWMERKVTEWGCMQALIDFDGWRKWKAIAEKKASEDPEQKKQAEKEEKAKAKAALKAMFSRPPPSTRRDDSTTKKDDGFGGVSSTAGSAVTSPNEHTPGRRSHKGSRSQSGTMGSILGTTLEVDERE